MTDEKPRDDSAIRRLNPLDVISAIEAAFRDRYPTVVIPLRTQIATNDGVVLIMPCYDPTQNTLGMKLVTVLSHPACAEDRVQATYLLLDPVSGQPRLEIPASYLTDLRTAATSAVATTHLARDDAKTLGIFGTGGEACAHLKVVSLVRNFTRILVTGSTPEKSRSFAEEMSKELHVAVEAADARTCASNCDVICTCTTSSQPLFDGFLLKPGTHLNVIGAFQPHTREVDDVTVRRSLVVAETYDAVFAEAGDILIPLNQSLITRDHVRADLHELLSGKKTVRSSSQDITLFKSVGSALEDLATAELVLKP
jgi:ornithine cyclodeaminase/alanine dehydrogenase-like protein (mu-crystallin family)